MPIRPQSLAAIAVASLLGTAVVLGVWSGFGSPWHASDEGPPASIGSLNEIFSEENLRRSQISMAVHQAVAHQEQGHYAQAVEKHREAVTLAREVYSPEEYPNGHHDLAVCLHNLALSLQIQGELDESQENYEQAQAMFEAVHPSQADPELARCLRNYGALLAARGQLEPAREKLEQAVEMWQKLDSQPVVAERRIVRDKSWNAGKNQRRPLDAIAKLEETVTELRTAEAWRQLPLDLASSLEALGRVYRDQGDYETACELVERALDGYEKHYGSLSDAPPNLAVARGLDTHAGLLQRQGDFDAARRSFERALDMFRRMYPSGKFPDGHTDLAIVLNNLAVLLNSQGEFQEARRHYDEALTMLQRLYPVEEYPQGHIELARTMLNLAALHWQRGELSQAAARMREALEMQRRMFPAESFPDGHPEIARALANLGHVTFLLGQAERAEELLTESYAMRQRLYPAADYPSGHIDLAGSLDGFGWLRWSQGDMKAALAHYRDALAMRQRLYPAELYPGGHPELARTLAALAGVLHDAGDFERAVGTAIEAADMSEKLADEFYGSSSEAEALNYAAQQEVRDLLLSIWPRTRRPVKELYEHVARSKGAIFRATKRRQQLLSRSMTSENRAAYEEYLQVRRQMARLTLIPAGSGPERQKRLEGQLAELGRRKEQWERQLAGTLIDVGASSPPDAAPHARLLELLPAEVAVIDFIRYQGLARQGRSSVPEIRDEDVANETASGRATPVGFRGRGESRYAAFILRRGHSVVRVDLGPAAPIDAAVRDWRKAIAAEQETDAGQRLAERVWSKFEPHLGEETSTVLLSPEGRLAALPFAALPIRDGNGILLERYALATVPNTGFLLDQLRSATPPDGDGRLLAVGDVDYGDPTAAASQQPRASSPGKRILWPPLPATREELADLAALADEKPVVVLRGKNADPAAVVAELPQARWVHFATHGFFADRDFQAGLGYDSPEPESAIASFTAERTTVMQRNPLVLSGLVLAGANVAAEGDSLEEAVGDGGILSAEAIAALPLHDLEFVMLSACETGLGDVAGGEGVFGLQRAFHLAGARNVVGSLWRVDDQATAALMRLFYFKLWKQGKPPLAALREAQLTLYRHPARVSALAALRAPDFGELVNVPVPESSAADAASRSSQRIATRLWAGFVLSGAGGISRAESRK